MTMEGAAAIHSFVFPSLWTMLLVPRCANIKTSSQRAESSSVSSRTIRWVLDCVHVACQATVQLSPVPKALNWGGAQVSQIPQV